MTIALPGVDPTFLCPISNHSSSSSPPDSSQNSSIQNIFVDSSFNPSKSSKKSEKVSAKPLHRQLENLGFLNPASKSDLREFNTSFEIFEKRFDELNNFLDEKGDSLRHILAVPEYLEVNEDLINDKILFDQSSRTKGNINTGKEIYKLFEGFSLLVLHGYKFYMLFTLQKEFKEQINNYKQLRKNLLDQFQQERNPQITSLINSIDKDLDVFKGRFSLAYEDVNFSNIFKKSLKFLSKVVAYPVSFWYDHSYKICKYSLGMIGRVVDLFANHHILSIQDKWISHLQTPYRIDKTLPQSEHFQTIRDKVGDFLISLKKCEELEDVEKILDRNHITDIKLPLTFKEWASSLSNKSFEKQLVDSFCRETAQFTPSQTITNQFEGFLTLLKQCKTLEHVQEILKNNDMAGIELPSTFEEWTSSMSNKSFEKQLVDSFCRAIAQSDPSQTIRYKIGDFFISLGQCQTLEEVEKTLRKNGITDIELPLTLDQWNYLIGCNKRFKRQLVDSFCHAIGKTPFMNAEAVASRSKYLKKIHEARITKAKPIIIKHIEACSEKEDFTEIEAYFKELHIYLNKIDFENEANLPLSPKNKEDWLQCVQSEQFCQALAGQWVDYQETVAQMSLQGVRQIALSKNKVENKFLHFRKWEYTASIAANLIQLLGYLPYQSAKAGYACLCFIVKDLSKIKIPGLSLLYIGHPLYPDKSFKSDGILLMLAEHILFGSKYKPNEYSLEGYKVSVLINWYFLVARAHHLISILQQVILWLNVSLVENCIMGLKTTPFYQDARYLEICEASFLKRLQCHEEIDKLVESLEVLRIKDGKLIVSSNSKQQDPTQEFAKALGDADYDFFPSEVKECFEENFGIVLNSSNPPDIQNKLEEFVSQGEGQFVAQYQANRFSHLHR